MASATIRRLGRMLPAGRPLSEQDWAYRHRVILWIVMLHAIGVPVFGLGRGYPIRQVLLEAAPVAAAGWLARSDRLSRRLRACLTTTGLLTASAVLVQLSHGLIEFHFHFFVMLFVITFYQDWATFLLAVGYVLIDHGVVGVISPQSLYNHAEAWHSPVKWAVVHAVFIAGAGIAAITNWRLAERAQESERELTERLAYQASHDPLTGALNRREFERRVTDALADARQDGQPSAVCIIDLDRFKIVNDTCGHAAGDALLRRLTVLVQDQLRSSDRVARLGGDEFGVLLAGCPPEQAMQLMERVREEVSRFRFVWDGQAFTVGVSVGVAAVSPLATGVDELLRAADAACYGAKDKGRNRVHRYLPDDGDLARHRGQSHWAGRILAALEESRLELYYQPIVPIGQPSATGSFGELLLRLRETDGEVFTPGAFLPAAERYDLLPAIDRWVVATGLRTLGAAVRSGRVLPDDIFTINLSGVSIGDETFLAFVRARLAEASIPPRLICFEITETVAIQNLDVAVQFIEELRDVGCRFALDDFGNGLSSFTYLKRLPVDFLKIDGHFIRDILHDPIDRAMVESVNRIGQEMGLRTIAEFVENDAILGCLTDLGLDYAQGYVLGRPVPLTGFLATARPLPRLRRIGAAGD